MSAAAANETEAEAGFAEQTRRQARPTTARPGDRQLPAEHGAGSRQPRPAAEAPAADAEAERRGCRRRGRRSRRLRPTTLLPPSPAEEALRGPCRTRLRPPRRVPARAVTGSVRRPAEGQALAGRPGRRAGCRVLRRVAGRSRPLGPRRRRRPRLPDRRRRGAPRRPVPGRQRRRGPGLLRPEVRRRRRADCPAGTARELQGAHHGHAEDRHPPARAAGRAQHGGRPPLRRGPPGHARPRRSRRSKRPRRPNTTPSAPPNWPPAKPSSPRPRRSPATIPPRSSGRPPAPG